MNTAIVMPNVDPNHSVAHRGVAAGLFMLLAAVVGCVLLAKALRLCRQEEEAHEPHLFRPAD